MALAKADWDLMKRVCDYFESTKLTEEQLRAQREKQKKRGYEAKTDNNGSINETAAHFKLTRTKVTKMLVTMGAYSSPQVEQVQELRNQGLNVKEIAAQLKISVGTVSSYLPYTDEFHGTAEPSEHARAVREYRAYEKARAERQVQNQGKKAMMEERNGREQEMSKDEMDRVEGKTAGDDWKKDLDSRLSFTATDSRRPRITYEMIEESGIGERSRAALEAGGIELPEDDREAERERLRNKLKETGSLSSEERLDLGEFPGALYDRNTLDLEEIYGNELPYEPREMIRLHLELDADFSDSEKETMRKYGSMEGETISRDVVVSDDLPLYALHYVIQRAFGWQNSHLHRFYLPDEAVERLTESVEQWMDQVGVIYRSPLMDENAEFWADDYEGGSFKNWLRKKYTGPCVSQCWDEGLIGARESLEQIDLDREYYVEYGHYGFNGDEGEDGDGDEEEALPLRCSPVYGWDGRKFDPPEKSKYVHKFRVEVMKARDLPISLLDQVFERGAFDILERLPIGQVLAVRNMHCLDDFRDGEYVSDYQEMLDDGMDDEIDEILESGFNSPMKQPFVYSFTDELLYQYDFGDSWQISITGSRNCTDLVEEGKITQDMLDKSNIKARVTYRPVLLARDGEMLIDDVGGASGMAEFIRAINTMRRGERDENGMTRTQLKEWAKSQGWHKDDSTDYHLI